MAHRLLVVDDAPAFRDVAVALLRADGFDVVATAPDGLSALALVSRIDVDVVVLDVGLPDMDGFAVASRLTSAGQAAPCVVLVSSRDWSHLEERLSRCGAAGFVHKSDLDGDAVRQLMAGRS